MGVTLPFKEAHGADRFVLGGKGFGLVEMTSLGLPVPPGFIITTQACKQYYASGRVVPAGLFAEIRSRIKAVEAECGRKFGGSEDPLLFSVRSGAPFSMPGMMDTILNIGMNDEVALRVASSTGNEKFAYDSYRRLIQMLGRVGLGANAESFERVLVEKKRVSGVEMDIDLTAEALREVVEEFKGLVRIQTGADFPQDPYSQLELAVEAVLKSWNNDRAREYRRFYKIPDDLGTAIVIQRMVFGNLGSDSGSGVGFTRNPSTGEKELFGEYLANSQGEDVVAGIRTPVGLESLGGNLIAQIREVAGKLESHFRDMQDFEFTVEKGRLYTLQTRNGKRTAQASVRIAVEMAEERLITPEEAVLRVDPPALDSLLHRRLAPGSTEKSIARGLNASPGAASGKVVLDTDEAASTGGQTKLILVRAETTPEDIKGMIAAQGVLTARGGMTSHAAVVARGMGKPAVVGCSQIEISRDGGYFTTTSGERVSAGETITIDGTTGNIYRGEVKTVEPDLSEEFVKLLKMADGMRKMGVWANADTPEASLKAKEFGAEGIGLCRTERMFNSPDRLPIVREMIMSADEGERRENLYRLFPFQLADFRGILSAMAGMPVVFRLLDLPLHEFLPPLDELIEEMQKMRDAGADEEKLSEKSAILARVRQLAEHNPMLGHRGCRLAVTYPEIYEMQTKAILTAALELDAEGTSRARVKIMVPLVSHVEEFRLLHHVVEKAAGEVFAEAGRRTDFQIGNMVETPRAALTSAEFAKLSDFFSFGTNDLSQMTFGFSRDDVEAKFIPRYLELGILPKSPFDSIDVNGVGRLVKMAVSEGRGVNPHLEVGICGEHGGDPASIALFSEAGLDYVSCSAYRVPVARLAAAQAASGKKSVSTTV